MNTQRTYRDSVTDALPARYELIDKDGNWAAEFSTADFCAVYAKSLWPDQKQDPERTGKGWDVQVVGPRTAPESCPHCCDESDCSSVDICNAVADAYRP